MEYTLTLTMRSGMRRKKEKMSPKKATQKMNTPAWWDRVRVRARARVRVRVRGNAEDEYARL